MLAHTLTHKRLAFRTVLMDSWYASKALMLQIHAANKIFFCLLKPNRLVCDDLDSKVHQPLSQLRWSDAEAQEGKRVHLHQFPKGFYLSLFRLPLSTERTEYVVTNATTQLTTTDAQQACAVRWNIEQAHRELKQTTGIERCQCRNERMQRNHIGCKSVILNILSENNAISLATTGGEYSPWILGAYFASDDLTIYLLLEKSGKTLANLRQNPKGALMISQNDAMKDFLQAQFEATLLPDSDEDKVRKMLVAKMPWYQTYTPCAPVRLDVSKWFVSSLARQWFPAKVLETSLINA
jgi:hypothetical protein